MASGHVNRIKRPNTWLQRPMLQNREERSCQTGAVHTWHSSDVLRPSSDVRCWRLNRPKSSVPDPRLLTNPQRTFAGVKDAKKTPADAGAAWWRLIS